MKKAILVTGEHFVGKSKTINKYLKPMLGIKPKAYLFILNNRRGLVVSQTIEESGRSLKDLIKRCSQFDFVVIATRSVKDPISKHRLVEKKLRTNGFRVKAIEVTKSSRALDYKAIAKKIFNELT